MAAHLTGQVKVIAPAWILDYATNVHESVAKHGYRLIFDDGHQAIYSAEYLYCLASEFPSRWQQYLDELKASGQTREVLIDIKQL